jgi:hypothetical protein
MRDFIPEPVADPVNEAHRYVKNAITLLKEHGQLDYETQLYNDRKYVRMAGNTLWNGVLLIIDSVFHVKNTSRQHPDVNDYRNEIAKRDQKLLSLFNAAYEFLHVYMGYDGYPAKAACNEGIRLANDIIDRCSLMQKKQPELTF